MNTNSNTYTILYSAGLVILVAAALAFAANSLKAPQERNKEIEKKMNILISVNKAADISTTTDKNTYIEQEYNKYIVDSYLINDKGQKVDGSAFETDLKAELKKKDKADQKYPIFECNDNGKILYIIPLAGTGMWGPIGGYISLQDDVNTIAGATFEHQGETPGLGAEIATPPFQKPFIGKKIFNGNDFVSIKVIKPESEPINEHNVDGVSGGTVTSTATGKMLFDCLSNYQAFFVTLKQTNKQPEVTTSPADSSAVEQIEPKVVEQ